MIRGDAGYGRKPNRSFMEKLAEIQPVSVHNYDEHERKTTIETIYNADAVIDKNREEFLSGHDGYTPSRDFKKVASIPMGEIARLYQDGINIMDNNDWPKIKSLLDSIDFQKWRTAPGKIASKPLREYIPVAKR